jgi:hypothetical protein
MWAATKVRTLDRLPGTCGCGGSYDGFDVVPSGVAWCQATITSRHPHFRFQHVDIYNKTYFRLPYADNTFDFAFLAPVFTHILPDDIENYAA